ncbi:MAG: molybdopterin cofactor-binding domain-containing protein [Myxococcota bacterium]
MKRREFLRNVGLGTTGLTLSFHLPACTAKKWGAPRDLEPNAALRITPDGTVIFTLARVEMGQGTLTSETMMVAEELNHPPANIQVVHAPAHSDFANPEYGVQITGGSNSTHTSWPVLRKAGAMAREALLSAAAADWGVNRREIELENGTLTHAPSGRSASIGSFATRAQRHLDDDAKPKDPTAWRILGRDHRRLDARAKVDGTAVFGSEAGPRDAEVAVVLRGPLKSRVLSFDAEQARQMRGVKDVFEISTGVAVVADRTYRARRAADTVKVAWSESDFSTETMWRRYVETIDHGPGSSARYEGQPEQILKAEGGRVEAEYRLPFLNHATMEPQNCTATVRSDACEIWVPTQAPLQCALQAREVTGLPLESISVHQTLLGGGFGRRGEVDFVREAVEIAKKRGRPVRVQWSREDDVQHDFYRPASLHRLQARVEDGSDGLRPVAWSHSIVQESAFERPIGLMMKETMPSPLARTAAWAMTSLVDDPSIVEGAADLPYRIEHLSVDYHTAPPDVPVGFWRAVGHSSNGFVVESFIDELAHEAGRDPLEFRQALLSHQPRHLQVLNLAAEKAGWGTPLSEGRARGVAIHKSFGSYVAQVAEVSVQSSNVKVHRVVAAVDCGTIVHPDGVRAQIESGIVFGLSAAIKQQAITFEAGRVQQSNFHDFEMLRMDESPDIEVHLVESTEDPTGVGEPGLPPIAAAVGNAVFALTGRRLRSLPLKLT